MSSGGAPTTPGLEDLTRPAEKGERTIRAALLELIFALPQHVDGFRAFAGNHPLEDVPSRGTIARCCRVIRGHCFIAGNETQRAGPRARDSETGRCEQSIGPERERGRFGRVTGPLCKRRAQPQRFGQSQNRGLLGRRGCRVGDQQGDVNAARPQGLSGNVEAGSLPAAGRQQSGKCRLRLFRPSGGFAGLALIGCGNGSIIVELRRYQRIVGARCQRRCLLE
jgi:hypothetical protein